jgi:hypothetical protein
LKFTTWSWSAVGGTNEAENLVTLCSDCHAGRHAVMPGSTRDDLLPLESNPPTSGDLRTSHGNIAVVLAPGSPWPGGSESLEQSTDSSWARNVEPPS